MTRVVVVDDDATFRAAASELLDAKGFDVVGTAGTAGEARELIARLLPDGVLLDVHLPDGNGYALSADLTATADPPTVLLTSSDTTAGTPSALRGTGAAGFVSKLDLARAELSRWLR